MPMALCFRYREAMTAGHDAVTFEGMIMKTVLMAACVVALVGCGGGDDEPAKATDKFIGTWSVRYSGADSGTCTLQITSSSSLISVPFTGTCRSVSGVSVPASGAVDGLGGVSAASGSSFRLSGSLSGNLGSGSWTVGGLSGPGGSWSAAR